MKRSLGLFCRRLYNLFLSERYCSIFYCQFTGTESVAAGRAGEGGGTLAAGISFTGVKGSPGPECFWSRR